LKLDIYGQGDAENELQEIIKQHFSSNNVSLKGFVSQDKLFSLLPNYDVGVAFIYDHPEASFYCKAPSLKSLEYAAAGLPVIASKTPGHLDYMNRFGFKFELFNNTLESFQKLINKLTVYGFNENDVANNLKSAKRFDWDVIAQTKLLPFYEDLVDYTS
jgi:glycosyltransferase involved in cell wall biosynthesis